MSVEIRIRFDWPFRRGPTLLLLFGLASGAAAIAANVAEAAPKHSFQPNGTVSASQMNDNFSDLDARLTALEGVQRTEWVVLDAACGVARSSGDWFTVAQNGAGDCTLLFRPDRFKGTPVCVGSSNGSNGASPRYVYSVRLNDTTGLGLVTAAGTRVRHTVLDTTPLSNVGSAEPFTVMCVGPR